MIPPVDTEKLDGYNKIAWSEDYFYETDDKKYGMWFYNVNEASMGSYYGHISIFLNGSDGLPLLSSGQIWIWFSKKDTFIYTPKSDCLIFRMIVYQKEINRSDYPFLLIKPGEKVFSFIEWKAFTSIYYSLEELDKNIVKATELSPDQLDRINYSKRTGELINLEKLVWYDLSRFENAEEIYLAEI